MEISRMTCPQRGGRDYQFRSRMKVAEERKPEAAETKYRCKACGQEWRVRVPAAG